MKPRYRILWDKNGLNPDFWLIGSKDFYFYGFGICIKYYGKENIDYFKQRVGLNN